MYPVVGVHSPGCLVDANFGQEPFVYDIEVTVILTDDKGHNKELPNCGYRINGAQQFARPDYAELYICKVWSVMDMKKSNQSADRLWLVVKCSS